MKSVWLVPLGGGITAALLAVGSRFLIGTMYSDADAVQLIEALSRSGLYLGAAIATASATILALMLTLLGFARRLDEDFDSTVYRRINRVGFLSTISLCCALFLLLFLTLPVGEFTELPDRWFPWMYNILITFTGVLTGLLITTVLLLYTTLRHVTASITPNEDV